MTRATAIHSPMRHAAILISLAIELANNAGCAQLGVTKLLGQAGAFARGHFLDKQLATDVKNGVSMVTEIDPAPEATRLDAIAIGLLHAGRSQEAISIAEQSLAIREKALGPDHLRLAYSLEILAEAYDQPHANEKSERFLERAIGIRAQALGKTHPDIVKPLNHLARLYMQDGDYERAEPLLLQAMEAKAPPIDTAHTLHYAALLELNKGEYGFAQKAFTGALGIYKRQPQATYSDIASSLDGLALTHQAEGAYDKAEPLFIEALSVRERALGGMHLRVASSLGNLALHYQARGAYARAQPLFLRALAIQERLLGATHPTVAGELDDLARNHELAGSYAAAEPLLARATEIHEAQLQREIAPLSEQRKRSLMTSLQDETDSVVSLSLAVPSSPGALDLALTTVLRRKGRALEALAANRLALHEHSSPALLAKRKELDSTNDMRGVLRRSQYSHDSPLYKYLVKSYRETSDKIESELNAAGGTAYSQSEPVTIAAAQAALPTGTMLVELVRIHHVTTAGQRRDSQSTRYVAFLLPPHGMSRVVDLGETAPIDIAIDAVLGTMHKATPAEDARAALQQLDTLLLGPLRSYLSTTSHIIFSPDGKLDLVPFEALIDARGRYELEERLVSYLSSGRDLLRLQERREPRGPVTVVAAPLYGPPEMATSRGVPPFLPLPGALAETTALKAHFPEARLLVGKHATKESLAATTGPGVLHIATHGFYARARATATASAEQPTGSILAKLVRSALSKPGASRGIDVEAPTFASLSSYVVEDPTGELDRAGLALSLANVADFGIVTAREIAGYDWWGTRLVVLSGCETGVGAVPSGEGVYGMRRALVLAGTESQVVSLWSVSDAATSELMRMFYGELANGTGRAEALRRAKLALMRQPQFAHPYYWAAFIPAGDWTPLDPELFKPAAHAP